MPKVSFVMPVHNGEKYIKKTIQSILQQTEKDIQLIIVNDHSDDNTWNIINNMQKQDNRIKVLNLKGKRGAAAGRNLGTKVASGNIILPTDADDPCYPNRAEISITQMQKNNADVFYGNLMRSYVETDKKELRQFQPYNAEILRNINIVPNSASAYKKSVFDDIGGYDEALKVGEDYDFWLSAQDKGYKFTSLNQPVTYYSMHEGQLTGVSKDKKKIEERQKWNRLVRAKHNIYSVDPEYVKTHAEPSIVDFYTNKNYDIWFAPETLPSKK